MAGDDDGIDAGTLELDDLVAARAGELGDRELAGGNVGQQLEQPVEMVLSSSASSADSSRISGSKQLQDLLELLLVADARTHSRPRPCDLVDHPGEPVAELTDVDDERVGVARPRARARTQSSGRSASLRARPR